MGSFVTNSGLLRVMKQQLNSLWVVLTLWDNFMKSAYYGDLYCEQLCKICCNEITHMDS